MSARRAEPALVVLADGTYYEGEAFGHPGEALGEVVFNTSMSGYQEILTDPSYRGQLVTMTSAHVGNYGVNELDVESDRVQVAGYIVREASRTASSFRATGTLEDYLSRSRTTAVSGVDTRALTRRIRDGGAIMGAIVHGALPGDAPAIAARVRAAPPYGDTDYVAAASVEGPRRVFLEETGDAFRPHRVRLAPESEPWPEADRRKPEVAVIDYGVKYGILRNLARRGLRVTVLPHDVSASDVLAREPAGVLLSNGPGDPAVLAGAVECVRDLLGKRPIFGICLGHQLLGRAVGGETFKLKFGHRGPNQPVLDVRTGRVLITSQNHGYAVDAGTLDAGVEVTHTNLNDRTVEGLRISRLQAFSVQHHPEAGPGPHDSLPMFEEFRRALS